MVTDRASELPADSSGGEPGSEAIDFAKIPQQPNAVPSLDAVIAAQRLSTSAYDLLRAYAREQEPRSDALLDAARVRLRLALGQLAPSAPPPPDEIGQLHYCPWCGRPCTCTRWAHIDNCEHDCEGDR